MDAQFTDRLLRCSDCEGEFIFTAGEQLFFLDKQFKNDPKRCKPCKSRRSGLATVANGTGPAAAGLSRTETRTTCSECSIDTTVPFKPTQGRPVLCRQCFQARHRLVPQVAAQAAAGPETGSPALVATTAATTTATISALTQVSADGNGPMLTAAEALIAASSMASASPESSVASAADLASISFQRGPAETHAASSMGTEVLAAANATDIPAELVEARAEAAQA